MSEDSASRATGKSVFGQAARYIFVGPVIYGLDYLTFVLITYLATGQYLWANVAAKLVGAGTGFLLHKYYTFAGVHAHAGAHQAVRYGLLLGFNMGLATALLYLAVQMLTFPPLVAKVGVDIVVIGCSFLISRAFVFAHYKGDQRD
ncbi:GtrA family protein [Kordiimonas lipolytica]|uniref:GtrA family protein n=1 Tax=Kordiimonas lipolytica TaxID=1662421 RepID=A0ABV8UFC3_9PROT|nr:GtrA family protein [Kordiimonas lipolytica]